MIKVSNPFSQVPPLFSDLAKTLSGEIECSQNKISEYSKNNSPYTIRPQAIIYPKNSGDIKHVFSFAREYTMPITVRGNGTSFLGGSLGEGIIIDMSRYFTNIRHINMLEHTITVDAGVTIKTLREKLHNWKMDIPILTAQDNESTLGSLISTKNVTPSSFHFSTIREWVEGLTVVVDTGEEHHISDGVTPSGRLLGIYQAVFPILSDDAPILRASKPETSDDATGYSIWNTSIGPRQLINHLVGSEGTLGIITTVTLRITPFKANTETICLSIKDKKEMLPYIATAKNLKAEEIFMYDSTFMELVDRYQPLRAPSFPDARYLLCITFSGNSQVEASLTVERYIKNNNLHTESFVRHVNKKFIEDILEPSFFKLLLTSYTQGSLTPIHSCAGLIVPIDNYTNALEEIEKYLYSTGKLYVITGNIASGHMSATTLFDPLSKSYKNEIDTYSETIFGIIKKYKGGISAKDGEGILKAPYLPYIYNQATIETFIKIKKAWDPLYILNPGKKLGTTTNYLHDHLT